ncbi:radical SAM protein, partial [Candidatus Thorarchaeota archaeon]
SCFYCPLSVEKRGHDVIFADEMPVRDTHDVLHEARAIRAEGSGISGGDPLCRLDRTVEYIRLLKEEFGLGFHVHLYTSVTDVDQHTLERLVAAGLDEIRFHPQGTDWAGIERALETDLCVGIEVPAIPEEEDRLKQTVLRAEKMGVSFVNVNELEASETNFQKLASLGMKLTDMQSASIEGSEATAKAILDWAREVVTGVSLHYCSARYKDAVQMRRRLERRLEETIREFEQRDDSDPLLVLGIIRAKHGEELNSTQLNHLYEVLRRECGIPEDMMSLDDTRDRVEIASWILEETAAELKEIIEFSSLLEMGIAYEYPTWDRLQTLFEPL